MRSRNKAIECPLGVAETVLVTTVVFALMIPISNPVAVSSMQHEVLPDALCVAEAKPVLQVILGEDGWKKNGYAGSGLTIETEISEEIIPYTLTKKNNPDIPTGTTVIKQKGAEGYERSFYWIFSIGGSVIYTKEAGYESMCPIDEIIETGVDQTAQEKGLERLDSALASRGGGGTGRSELNYSSYIDCAATSYYIDSCGKKPGDYGYGITATGAQAAVGCVAVDPAVIPLGTRLYIESADGSYVYGYGVAADTGGAIKGNKVDLFMNSYGECMSFGRRNVRVYILN